MPKRKKTRDPQIFTIGEIFYMRVRVNGVRVERRLEAENLTMAKLMRDEIVLKIRSQGVTGAKVTAKSLFVDYLKDREREVENKDIRASTIEETKTQVRAHLEPFFGHMAVSLIEEPQWEAFKRKFGKKDPTNPRKVLTHFLRWCKTNGYLKYVPEFKINKRKRRERVNLTEAEIQAVFPFLSETSALIAGMCLLMGLRPGEARSLTWDRVDFKYDCLIFRDIDTKTNQGRVIPLNPTIRAALKARYGERTGKFVFPNKTHRNLPYSKNAYIEAMARARAKATEAGKLDRHVTMHDLRATFESRAHMNPNFSDTQLEKMVGSAVDLQRRIYVKTRVEELRGLETAVQVEGIAQLLTGRAGGKAGEKKIKKTRGKRAK